MSKNIVISGSGISGLLSALLLSEIKPECEIFIIDKANEIGGLLRAFNYGENGVFDYGMHNMLETGFVELDKLIFDLLPPEEWQILEAEKRDLSGIFFNGKLQQNSIYIDLRNLEKSLYRECLADFFDNLNTQVHNENIDETQLNAYDYAKRRFGTLITERIIAVALEKNHKKPIETLDYMATLLTPMNRVVLFDEPVMQDFLNSDLLRSKIAFTEQRNLPIEKSSGRKAYYPIKYGMWRIVEGFIKKLEAKNVHILTETEIKKISHTNQQITSIEIEKKGQITNIENIEKLIWTSNVPAIGSMLKLDYSQYRFDKPLKTVVVNILVSKPLDMGDLYYFFCYDKNFNTYRLTNFSNYCNGAYRNGGYPISIEMLIEPEKIESNEQLTTLALQDLHNFKIMQEGTEILFAKAEILESGFPMPTVNNIKVLKDIRNRIKDLKLDNLLLLGILAEDNLFFQTDVLIDTYKKLKN